MRGTGVGSTTGEGEEESVVPSTKRARATGNKAYYVPKFLVNLVFILSVDVELPFLIIRNCAILILIIECLHTTHGMFVDMFHGLALFLVLAYV